MDFKSEENLIYNKTSLEDARALMAEIESDLYDVDNMLYDAVLQVGYAKGFDAVERDNTTIDMRVPERLMIDCREVSRDVATRLNNVSDTIDTYEAESNRNTGSLKNLKNSASAITSISATQLIYGPPTLGEEMAQSVQAKYAPPCYNFDNSVQALYGVARPSFEEVIGPVQAKYAPPPHEFVDHPIQALYGVAPPPVQALYGVAPIDDLVGPVQAKYAPPFENVDRPVQPLYGVPVQDVQPLYGVARPIDEEIVGPVQPLYGVAPPLVQPLYGVAPTIPTVDDDIYKITQEEYEPGTISVEIFKTTDTDGKATSNIKNAESEKVKEAMDVVKDLGVPARDSQARVEESVSYNAGSSGTTSSPVFTNYSPTNQINNVTSPEKVASEVVESIPKFDAVSNTPSVSTSPVIPVSSVDYPSNTEMNVSSNSKIREYSVPIKLGSAAGLAGTGFLIHNGIKKKQEKEEKEENVYKNNSDDTKKTNKFFDDLI